jgi:hypothetical protein
MPGKNRENSDSVLTIIDDVATVPPPQRTRNKEGVVRGKIVKTAGGENAIRD